MSLRASSLGTLPVPPFLYRYLYKYCGTEHLLSHRLSRAIANQSAQKNKAVGRIQSNRRHHFHQRTLSDQARQYNRAASRKLIGKIPISKCGGEIFFSRLEE